MFRLQVKALVSFAFLFLINNPINIAQPKICEIKYNEPRGAKSLEAKINLREKKKYLNDKSLFDCYIIGLEHDDDKKPLENKPIYACCKNM